jgi:hypothetical protein
MGSKAERQRILTEALAKGSPGKGEIVFRLVVHVAECADEDVEEDEGGKEELPATLIDHPDVKALLPCDGLLNGLVDLGIDALKTLKTLALGLVALEVGWLSGQGVADLDIWMVHQVAVCKVKTVRAHVSHYVQKMRRPAYKRRRNDRPAGREGGRRRRKGNGVGWRQFITSLYQSSVWPCLAAGPDPAQSV